MKNVDKKNILLIAIVCMAIGILLYAQYIESASPRISARLDITRSDAIEQARSYLTEREFATSDLYADAIYRYNFPINVYLQTVMSVDEANRHMRESSKPYNYWLVSLYDRSLPRNVAPEEFQVFLSPNGDLAGYNRILQATSPGSNLTEEQAYDIVTAYIEEHNIDLSEYKLQRSSAQRLDNRTDWEFFWQRESEPLGLEESFRVVLQGDEIGVSRVQISAPKSFMDDFYKHQTPYQFLMFLNYTMIFLLFFAVVITFLKRYHEGEVGIQSANMVLIGVYVIAVLDYANVFYYIGQGYGIGQMNNFNVRFVVFAISVLIILPFFNVMTFAGWSVGESYSRSLWNEKLNGFDSFLQRKFFTYPFGAAIVRGYGYGILGVGVGVAGLSYSFDMFPVETLAMNLGGITESFIPGLQPVLAGLWVAAMSEIVFRMFIISYCTSRFGKKWIGVLISIAIWILASMAVWTPLVTPTYFPLLFVLTGLFGAYFAFLFIRYDLVTAITANFITIALTLAVPLYAAEGSFYQLQAYVFGGLMIIPLGIGFIGTLWGKPFAYSPDTIPPHIKRISQRERMSKELEIARAVQMSLLPKQTPRIEGFDIAGICIPAQEVGGDYFDYVPFENGNWGIAVGDVSGKGVPAAIYMTLTKGVLQSHAESTTSPKDVLTKVNHQLYGTIERNTFVSMVYAVLDVKKKTMRYSRAGHNPVLLTKINSESVSTLIPKGIALGLDSGTVFKDSLEENTLALHSGDIITFFTDGFTEARQSTSIEYGQERFINCIKKHRSLPSRQIIQNVVKEIRTFRGEYPQHDDMTIVIVKVL